MRLRAAARPGGPRIVESVGVAFVAVERRRRRVQRQDRLPESFGEGVDGRGIGIGQGHGWISCGIRRLGADDGAVARSLPLGRRGRPAHRSNNGICSLPCSTLGSRPRYGSRSARSSGSRARNARSWSDFTMCQCPRVQCRPQQRRASELEADEIGPLRCDDEEPDDRVVRRDPGMAAKQRLAEHRGPFDLEQERDLAPDVPDAVDLGEVLGRRPDPAEIQPPFARFEQVAEQPALVASRLLALADPDLHPQPATGRRDRREQVGVLLAAPEEVVAGDDPVGRAGRAPVARRGRRG